MRKNSVKDRIYLAVDLTELSNVVGFAKTIKKLTIDLNLSYRVVCKVLERKKSFISQGFKFVDLDLTENREPTGKYVIEYFREVPRQESSYINNFPIIRTVEEERLFNLIHYTFKKDFEVLERYEFDNIYDFYECREDLIALGGKGHFKCYCNIFK